jgi:hypothetical protein
MDFQYPTAVSNTSNAPLFYPTISSPRGPLTVSHLRISNHESSSYSTLRRLVTYQQRVVILSPDLILFRCPRPFVYGSINFEDCQVHNVSTPYYPHPHSSAIVNHSISFEDCRNQQYVDSFVISDPLYPQFLSGYIPATVVRNASLFIL